MARHNRLSMLVYRKIQYIDKHYLINVISRIAFCCYAHVCASTTSYNTQQRAHAITNNPPLNKYPLKSVSAAVHAKPTTLNWLLVPFFHR